MLIELGADFEKTPGTFNPLILAVEQGNKPMVELLLQNKNVTELKHPSPMNVLKSAILKGDIPIIDLLISKGIDVNVDIDKGWSPFEASLHGENMDVVKFLIKQGADIHKDAARNLAFAYNREMVEFLLNKGVDINARDKRSEKTALQMAITSQIGKRAKLLIKKGADIHGRTEVSFSSAKFPFVLNKATLLHLAVDHYPANNNVFIGIMEPPPVKVLLENGAEVNAADEGVTPLHLSVRQENIELIQLLIDFGAKVDVRDKYGHTPLYWARTLKKDDVVDLLMKNGSTSIPETEILRKENCESLKKVKAFYNSGGNIKARGIYGETALHLAAVYGNSEVVEWLIKQGLDVNAQTWGKHTPLHRVANVKSAELLLEHGAEINQKDLWGFTPLTWAVFWNNEDVSGVSQELVKLFVNSGSDVNVAINADQSILEIAKMISQQSGDTTVVDYLIAHGAKE
ncbi:ankyrin repeat domain-containing protein [Nitrospina gracilis]|uniref:ankyrin repeat domain-containing protein n=1 Tax=Nitrospina gracilis TaxID=35801 RepID=UPI00034D6C6A|nr:ankyrin repeat domain-containing protein [Nitrospina gracilis]